MSKIIKLKRKGRYAYFGTEVPAQLQRTLYNKLSYVKKGAQFMPNPMWANVYFYKKKTNSFPIGLVNIARPVIEMWCRINDYEYVQEFAAPKEDLETDNIDKRARKYQLQAITRLVENNGGIIHLPTGSGKTFTAVNYLNLYPDKKVLIVVPTIDLRTQWGKENIVPKTDIKTYQSIKDYKMLEPYDIVVFDECHHLPAKSLYNIAMKCHKAVMIGLSATPFRDDGEDMRMYAALGEIVFSITLRELIDQGYLVDAEIKVHTFNHDAPDVFSEYHDIVDLFVVNNQKRNELICHIACNAPKPCLILVDKLAHGKLLEETLDAPFIHGSSKDRTEKLQALKDGSYDIAIASKIYNEGVDVPILKSLVLAAGGKSSVKITQQIGRVLRPCKGKDKAYIYDIFDNAKYLRTHSNARRDIYEQNFEIKWIRTEKN